jgi:hypothetical protein
MGTFYTATKDVAPKHWFNLTVVQSRMRSLDINSLEVGCSVNRTRVVVLV